MKAAEAPARCCWNYAIHGVLSCVSWCASGFSRTCLQEGASLAQAYSRGLLSVRMRGMVGERAAGPGEGGGREGEGEDTLAALAEVVVPVAERPRLKEEARASSLATASLLAEGLTGGEATENEPLLAAPTGRAVTESEEVRGLIARARGLPGLAPGLPDAVSATIATADAARAREGLEEEEPEGERVTAASLPKEGERETGAELAGGGPGSAQLERSVSNRIGCTISSHVLKRICAKEENRRRRRKLRAPGMPFACMCSRMS